ncbi:MAG: iron-sulfur cluster assembly protein [Alphaproteobacteria bacterium]|nr:iron-sulfur cluster assembly protein [Alphaproteobacteria bacterium]
MMQHVADDNMIRSAVGDEEMEQMLEPPDLEATREHPLWPLIRAALREVYDPEIPVNIYELGLIYKVDIAAETNKVYVEMTLTSPACPVAGEMPGMIENAIRTVQDVGDVIVDIIWDPPWDPSKMAETAKLQLNMF